MKWYKYNIQDLRDAEYNKWYSLMSEDKQRRVDRFHFENDKKRTVVGEMLARKAIAKWCEVTPESIRFSIGEHGKPYVEDFDVEFNISHSGDMVVCAIDDNPVGIDIEQIRPIDLTVAKRICTDEELLFLFAHTPIEEEFAYTTDMAISTRFFEIWTKKEAFGKCLGNGVENIRTNIQNKFVQSFVVENYMISICH